MRAFSLIVSLFLAGVFAPVNAARVFEIQVAGPIAEFPLSFSSKQESHTIELRNVDRGANPILQVIGPDGGESSGAVSPQGKNAIGLRAGNDELFTLLVRSQSDGAYRADVWVDGKLAFKGIVFSRGTTVSLPDLSPGEEIVTTSPPNGLTSHTAYLMSANGSRILARADGAKTTLQSNIRGDAMLIYGSSCGAGFGRVIVYRNDRLTDTDRDGLGDRLEAEIGTCAGRSGTVSKVSCAALTDTRDTDGDGLWDSWELMGKIQTVNGTQQLVPLNTWGAKPNHKDIFIETDFGRLTLEDNQSGLAEKMMPAIARRTAEIYADQATTDPALRAIHAQEVGNPDGVPGISLHFDTGVAPETPADATVYGDWGGYTTVNAVPDGLGGYKRQSPKDAMDNNFSEARRGLFHYVLGYTSGGGACGVGIVCGFNMASVANSTHEFGHTLWLGHSGPKGTREPNCKPNYRSLMNYAFNGTAYNLFSDGRGAPALNNHSLVESGILANEPVLQELLQTVFQYRVDAATGSVDWNRDGVFQPANTPVRAYANYDPGNGDGCEFTREGEEPVGVKTEVSPALVRYNNHLFLFTVKLNKLLEYSYTAEPWICQNIDDCPRPSFPYHVTREIGVVSAVDAAVINSGGKRVMIIVGIRPDGTLFETWMEMIDWQIVWHDVTTLPASPARGEPSLAVSRDGNRLTMVYKGTDGYIRIRTRGATAWGPEEQLKIAGQPFKMHAASSPGLAFTGLPIGTFANQENLVGAFSSPDGSLKLYTNGGFPAGWKLLPFSVDAMKASAGRPALAWTGAAAGTERGSGVAAPVTVGRFYVVYAENNPPAENGTNQNVVKMAMSYVDNSSALRIGLLSYYDNKWSFAFGIDLLEPGEVGLRAAESYAVPTSMYQVKFRPHADGISNLTYTNKNDWPVLAWATCDVLAAVQADEMKTTCGPKPW